MALASTQRLKEMSTRNKGRPAHKADNLTAICEPILENVGASTEWASTACYRDTYPTYFISHPCLTFIYYYPNLLVV
jgi:hypothetical protein